jgi:LPXTG-motif cell wall-anchored protein
VAFLAGSECPDGGFPLNYETPTCQSDTDATAMVVQALAVTGGNAAAAGRGIAWLASRQNADGSFNGTGTTDTPNSNTTGLAAEALRSAGRTAAADAAVTWLLARQSGCTAPVGERGAIAYDASGFEAGNAARVTPQAILGLVGVGLGDLTLTGATSGTSTLDCPASPTPRPTARPTATPSHPAPSTVAPTRTATATPVAPIAAPPTEPAAAGELANTGAETVPVFWTGLGLVLVGVVAVVAGRRRRTS